jgi:hypothetical protein
MTTGNTIIAETVADATYIPLECLNSQGDSVAFVYKKDGLRTVGQEVQLGAANSDHVIILAGLQSGEEVYLSVPEDAADIAVALIPEMDGKRSPQPEQAAPEKLDEGDGLDLPPGVRMEGDEVVVERNGREFRMSKERYQEMQKRFRNGGQQGGQRPGGQSPGGQSGGGERGQGSSSQ